MTSSQIQAFSRNQIQHMLLKQTAVCRGIDLPAELSCAMLAIRCSSGFAGAKSETSRCADRRPAGIIWLHDMNIPPQKPILPDAPAAAVTGAVSVRVLQSCMSQLHELR